MSEAEQYKKKKRPAGANGRSTGAFKSREEFDMLKAANARKAELWRQEQEQRKVEPRAGGAMDLLSSLGAQDGQDASSDDNR